MNTRHVVAIIAAFVLYLVAYRPAAAKVATLRRVVPREAEQLVQLRELSATYQSIASVVDRIRSGPDRRKIMGDLQKIAQSMKLSGDRLKFKLSDKRLDEHFGEVTAEATLSGVTIAQVSQFLTGVSEEPGILVRSLVLTPVKPAGMVDAKVVLTSVFASDK